MQSTKVIEWHTSNDLENLIHQFLEKLELKDQKHVCVFPNSLLKSTLFFYGCKKQQSFGLFQTFFLDELISFLKMTYQKKDGKRMLTKQELILFLQPFLEKNHIYLLDQTTPLTLKKELYCKLVDQLGVELYEAITNPNEKLTPKKNHILQLLLEQNYFAMPFDIEFEGDNELHIHLFGFDTFDLPELQALF